MVRVVLFWNIFSFPKTSIMAVAQEKAAMSYTLASLVAGINNMRTTVELRNEAFVTGKVWLLPFTIYWFSLIWFCISISAKQKMSESRTKAGNQRKFENFWKFEKFEILNSLSWSSGHAEQLLFSCLGWKVAVDSWKCQWFFLDLLITTRSTDIRVSRAGSQLKTLKFELWASLRPGPVTHILWNLTIT